MKTFFILIVLWLSFAGYSLRENKKPFIANLEVTLRRDIMNHDGHEIDYLKLFCDALVMRDMSDSVKVVVFLDWLCDYLRYDRSWYIYKKNGGQQERDFNWEQAITDKKTVCAGYAQLLCAMCETQNIDCRYVSGYAFTLDNVKTNVSIRTAYLSEYFSLYFDRHAWCVITYKDGNSHLVDPTWIDNLENYEYYQTDPFRFIQSHYPDDSLYQLIYPPVTLNELISGNIKKIRKMHEVVKNINTQIFCTRNFK